MNETNTVSTVACEVHSLKSYAAKVFNESSVGMVSSLSETSSNKRRFFKVLVFLLCLLGFLYQSAEFVAAFLHFHTTVNIDVIRPDMIKIPAFTFCNNNGIKRSLFCKKYSDRCEKELDNDGGPEKMVPKKEFYSVMSNMSLDEIAALNGNLDDFISYSQDNKGNITGPFLRKMYGNDLNVKMCYSGNERINSSEEQIEKEWNPLYNLPIESFEFYVEKNETFISGTQPGVLFSVHSPFIAVNPLANGIFMQPGKTYLIHVSMQNEEVLLPNPYDTDCINYTELWIQRGRTGPRSQDMCQHNCLQGVSMECLNCIAPVLHYPTSERICNTDESDVWDKCPKHIWKKAKNCVSVCKEDCHRRKYEYTIQERYTLKLENDEIKKNMENYIFVEIYVDDAEVIVLKHSPKYMMVELFSTIGGFVGCWLGISLLDISDIFESFFRITQYAYKKR